MVVLCWDVIRIDDTEFSCHAEMDPEPQITREVEEHLLAGGFRADEFLIPE